MLDFNTSQIEKILTFDKYTDILKLEKNKPIKVIG